MIGVWIPICGYRKTVNSGDCHSPGPVSTTGTRGTSKVKLLKTLANLLAILLDVN